jgi:hypothetical protein
VLRINGGTSVGVTVIVIIGVAVLTLVNMMMEGVIDKTGTGMPPAKST